MVIESKCRPGRPLVCVFRVCGRSPKISHLHGLSKADVYFVLIQYVHLLSLSIPPTLILVLERVSRSVQRLFLVVGRTSNFRLIVSNSARYRPAEMVSHTRQNKYEYMHFTSTASRLTNEDVYPSHSKTSASKRR